MNSMSEITNKDPFDSLIKKNDEAFDKVGIAEIVSKHLILLENGEISPKSSFKELTDEIRIWILLLGRKVLFTKKINSEEALGPTELSKLSNLGLSKTKRLVLEMNHLQNVGGKYFIPNYEISFVLESINNGQ